VIGLDGIKHNAEGGLRAKNGQLEFHASKSDASIPANSIERMFVGTEFTQNGGKELAGNKSNVPNGDDAASSAFVHSRVDMLTVVYRDLSGGLHAAVFALPKNYGEGMLAALIAQGGHVGEPEKSVSSADAVASPTGNQRTKLSAAVAIVVEPVSPGRTKIPAEFRMAIYEELVEQLREAGIFRQVFRAGDREAVRNSDLVTLRTTVAEFNEGSERTRELTYYAFGRTKIAVDVQVLGADGNVLVNQKATGRVLAVVENLEASHFVAENIRRQLSRNF
jgi:hypothetical protein